MPPTDRRRLLVLGIDAANGNLLERWIADGSLPNLEALSDRGVSGRVHGVDGFFVGATWPTMYTGTGPARHGVHYLTQLVSGSYEFRYCAQHEFVPVPTLWDALGRAGKRVAVLDVPLTKLDRGINGIQTVEWGGHDSVYGFSAHPTALEERILEQYGTHPVGATCDAPRRTAEDYATFVQRAEQGATQKSQLTRQLLREEQWDFLMQVFTEAHCTGHQCWHLHDLSHPAHDPAVRQETGDPLLRVYTAIDRAVGEIVADAGDMTVLVFSAHGMSHWFGAQFLLRDMLLATGAAVGRPLSARPLRLRFMDGVFALWRTLPRPLRRLLKRLTGNRLAPRPAASPPQVDVDVTRSRCFVQPNGLAVGGIRLNIAGREPHGLLHRGSEAEEFIAWLSDALMSFIDERTGRPIIARITRTSALYTGEREGVLPDLLVEWSDEVPTGSTNVANGVGAHVKATSPRHGTVEGRNEFGRTGEHRRDGWFVAAGAGIQCGRVDEIRLEDLAPTMAAILGVAMPDVDGKVVHALAGHR